MGAISLSGVELVSSSTNSEKRRFSCQYNNAGDLLWAKTVGRFESAVWGQRQPQVAWTRREHLSHRAIWRKLRRLSSLGSTNLPSSVSQDVFLAKFDPEEPSLARGAEVSAAVPPYFSNGIAVDHGSSVHTDPFRANWTSAPPPWSAPAPATAPGQVRRTAICSGARQGADPERIGDRDHSGCLRECSDRRGFMETLPDALRRAATSA